MDVIKKHMPAQIIEEWDKKHTTQETINAINWYEKFNAFGYKKLEEILITLSNACYQDDKNLRDKLFAEMIKKLAHVFTCYEELQNVRH